jgi:uncharacterized membrane protein
VGAGLIDLEARSSARVALSKTNPAPLAQARTGAATSGSTASTPTRVQLTVIAAVLIGFAGLSYYSDSTPDAPNLAAALSLAPVVVIGLALAWRWTRPLITVLIFALTCALLHRYWDFIRSNYQWSNLIQQAGVYGLVALTFARSLAAGQTPLCTQLAEKLHGPATPAEVAYTRRATAAWAAFYLVLSLAIVALFFGTSQRVWSLFVNFVTFGLIALMFFVEHAIRLKVVPRRHRGGTLTALRQFLIG